MADISELKGWNDPKMFFDSLNVGDVFTYSDEFTLSRVRTVAWSSGVDVEPITIGSHEYSLYGARACRVLQGDEDIIELYRKDKEKLQRACKSLTTALNELKDVKNTEMADDVSTFIQIAINAAKTQLEHVVDRANKGIYTKYGNYLINVPTRE